MAATEYASRAAFETLEIKVAALEAIVIDMVALFEELHLDEARGRSDEPGVVLGSPDQLRDLSPAAAQRRERIYAAIFVKHPGRRPV